MNERKMTSYEVTSTDKKNGVIKAGLVTETFHAVLAKPGRSYVVGIKVVHISLNDRARVINGTQPNFLDTEVRLFGTPFQTTFTLLHLILHHCCTRPISILANKINQLANNLCT